MLSAVFSQDSHQAVTGSRDNTVKVNNLLFFSSLLVGKYLGVDGVFEVWDISSGSCIRTVDCKNECYAVVITTDGISDLSPLSLQFLLDSIILVCRKYDMQWTRWWFHSILGFSNRKRNSRIESVGEGHYKSLSESRR